LLSNVVVALPCPDALQEFKVETSSLPANYGTQPGGVVNVATKAGTNEFHGTAFEFLRNYAMNAKNYFANTKRRPEAQPVWRNSWRTYREEQGVLFRWISRDT